MTFETPWSKSALSDCFIYHTFEIPGLGVVHGEWDLRPVIDDYLGHYDFTNKRVLDIGTASGFLSFHCERAGASEVVSFDQSKDHPSDVAPGWGKDFSWVDQMKKGYWLAHHIFGSKAKAFYGNVYNMPEELGQFDVALLGAILLHLENPHRALVNASRFANTLIVTDVHRPYLPDTGMSFRPSYPNDHGYWWYIPHGVATRMLITLGYKVAEPVMFKASGKGYDNVDFYSLVATR